MVSSSSSVLFLYVVFTFLWYSGSSTKLKFLLTTFYDIIRCSEHEYLVITDWNKLNSSNISCPNQAIIFENPSLPFYYNSEHRSICNVEKKSFVFKFYVWTLPLLKKKMRKFTEKVVDLFSSTVNVDNHDYPSKPIIWEHNSSLAIINMVELAWSLNNTFVLYTKFDKQPTICRATLTIDESMNKTACTGNVGWRETICYNDPLLTAPIQQSINWTSLMVFLGNTIYAPPDWEEKGGYYIDLQSFKTTVTSTTTTTTSVVPTTTTTTTTITTTATSTTTTTIISTDFDDLITSNMDLTTAVVSNADTTVKKIVKTTTKRHITASLSKKTSTKMKQSRNNSEVLKRPSADKNSSSRSIPLVILLIFFVFCIIGSVLFFIFRFRRNRQNADQSLLDRTNSDESYKSDMDESETSEDANSELPDIRKSRKGGRMVSQLDPDAL